MKPLQLFLAILILVGLGLLITQNLWVPQQVASILKMDTHASIVSQMPILSGSDPLYEAGTATATSAFACSEGTFNARIKIMPIGSQLGMAEITLPSGSKVLLNQVPFKEAPGTRYVDARGVYALQTQVTMVDVHSPDTFVEKHGVKIYSKCREVEQR